MSDITVKLNQRGDGSLHVSDRYYGHAPENVTQIPTPLVRAAIAHTRTTSASIEELLDMLRVALGWEPENAAIIIVRPS